MLEGLLLNRQEYLVEILEGEMVKVKAVKEYYDDFKRDIIKIRTSNKNVESAD